MAEIKTVLTDEKVSDFVESIPSSAVSHNEFKREQVKLILLVRAIEAAVLSASNAGKVGAVTHTALYHAALVLQTYDDQTLSQVALNRDMNELRKALDALPVYPSSPTQQAIKEKL